MKRYLVILTALVIISALIITGCGGTTTTTTAPTTSAPTTTAAPTTAKPTTTAPATAAPTSSAPTTTAAPTTAAPTTSAAAPTSAVPVAANAKKIKFSYTMPKERSLGFEWFATEFPKLTNGRYIVETYPSNTLVPTTGVLDAVKANTAQIAVTSTGTFPTAFPLTLVCSVPTLGYGFTDSSRESYEAGVDAIRDLANNTAVGNEFNNYKLLAPILTVNSNLVAKKKEIHLPSELKGLKVGGSGTVMNLVMASGGAKIACVPPDYYMNLDKGVIDAAIASLGQCSDHKLWEVCNYYYTGDFGSSSMLALMNKEFYASMSADDQKILMDTWRSAAGFTGDGAHVTLAAARAEGIKMGKTITAPTPEETAAWAKAATICVDYWMTDCKNMGISLDTCQKVLDTWKANRIKYFSNIKL
jgi:TRAP-type C4-dicarboxylate transport system substrate-binding protein